MTNIIRIVSEIKFIIEYDDIKYQLNYEIR